MKKIFALLLIAFALPFSTNVYADAVQFSISKPVNRADGTPLPRSQVIEYFINCGTTSGGPYDFATFIAPASQTNDVTNFTSPDVFTGGTYFCVSGTVTTNPDDGSPLQPAQLSSEATFTIAACTPATCGANAPQFFNANPL